MNKTALIIKREYLERVKKKSFVVMSILGPILFAAMMVLPALFASLDETSRSNIAVIDETGKYGQAISNTDNLSFTVIESAQKDGIKQDYKEKGFDAFLIIDDDPNVNASSVKIYSDVQVTMDTKVYIENSLERYIEKERMARYSSIDSLKEIINYVNSARVDITTVKLSDDGKESESSAEITMIAALIFAMMIYFFVLLYGAQVMRGVMEEKTNRIVEVIISSVKPFQLMMGKVVGIALVALTQFAIWIVFTLVIVAAVSNFAGTPSHDISSGAMTGQIVQSSQDVPTEDFAKVFDKVLTQTQSIDLIGALLAFLFFFIGGYLLYASIFAAIGSAIDNESDSQQFITPVMMPLILSIYIAMAAFRDPGGSIAFWFSMFPLTSPIVMMARIPFQIPAWEILLSMAILTASFIFSIWFSGRVYRVGILMYGKKITWKELWKWFRQAGR